MSTCREPRGGALVVAVALALVGAGAAHATSARFAVVLGVNRSVDPNQILLRYADDDAARTYDLMSALGAKVRLLSRLDENTARLHPQAAAAAAAPTWRALERAAEELAVDVRRARARGVETDVYFVYAGHGDVKDGKGSIALEDAHVDGARLKALLLDAVGPDRLHLVVDACASFYHAFGRGPGGERRALDNTVDVGGLAADPRVGLFLSTSSAAESHEWEAFQSGVFSHEVRSGLIGAADVDLDQAVTYTELYAFITAANRAIPNERYRPRVFARPPSSTAVLLDVRGLDVPRVEVPGRLAGRYLLETQDGVRLADFHTAPDVTVSVLRPPGVVFLRRVDDAREWRLPPKTSSLAALPAERTRASARGGLHESFAKLFDAPLTRADVTNVTFPEIPKRVPERGELPRSSTHGGRVAVLGLKPVSAKDQELAALATAAVADDLRRGSRREVITRRDIEALLDVAATKQLLGCPTDACLLDFTRVLDVDEVVTGEIGTRGGEVLVFLSRLDPVTTRIVGHASHGFPTRGDLRKELASVGGALYDEGRALRGDARLDELRVAVVAAERTPESTAGGMLGACLEGKLGARDVPLVDGRSVARIRQRLDPSAPLPDDLALALDEDVVDVLVLADVAYAPLDARGLGISSVAVTGTVRVVRVDTGAIVASVPVKAMGRGHAEPLAVHDAGARLCADVDDGVARALSSRASHGTRLVVEVEGAGDRTAATAVAAMLEGVPDVARVRVKRLAPRRAILEVVVEGGDGIALALALPETLVVKEASSARVVIAHAP